LIASDQRSYQALAICFSEQVYRLTLGRAPLDKMRDTGLNRQYLAGHVSKLETPSMTLVRLRGLLALAAIAAIPVAAQAHAVLIASQPALGATVQLGTVNMTLRYNSRIDARRSRLTLIRPDESQAVLPITPGDHEDMLTTTSDLSPGAYVLHWQVLAVDGHITRGEVPFTVGP
jgi:copper resistance protein C